MRAIKEQEVDASGNIRKEFIVAEPTKKDLKRAQQMKDAAGYALRVKILLTLFALMVCIILKAMGMKWYIYSLPMVLHIVFAFFMIMVKVYNDRNKERYWARYVKKYGDANGRIPDHVVMTHLKLTQQGITPKV